MEPSELDGTIRWVIVGVLALNIGVSGFHRRRARARGGTIERGRESGSLKAVRALCGLPALVGLVLYVVNPAWMGWAAVSLPAGVRWLGVGVAGAALPLIVWTFRSLGSNVSETIFTKEEHRLVTEGPYRWVRHPIYSVGILMWAGVSLAAANLFFGALTVATVVVWDRIVIPREEEELVKRFGEEYGAYVGATGRWLPRVGRGGR